jgi:creatinine amidohydrolase
MKLLELTKDEYLALDRDRVVPTIGLGATEQHGPHLPLGTDTFQIEAIVSSAEGLEPDLLLASPILSIGNSVNHLGFGAALTIQPIRYAEVLVDIGRCFLEQGFRHLLYVNGHGGNTGPLLTALHQLEYEYIGKRDDLQIAGTSWWSLAPEVLAEVRESPMGSVGHGCEVETSIVLSTRPDLVHRNRFVAGLVEHPHPEWSSYDLGESSRVSFAEFFHRDAPHGTIGLPGLASKEKGERLVAGVARTLAAFVRAFGAW